MQDISIVIIFKVQVQHKMRFWHVFAYLFDCFFLVSMIDKFNYSMIKFMSLSPINFWLLVSIFLDVSRTHLIVSFNSHPSLVLTNGLMNILCGLELLIEVKTLANPLTYLLNKSSRLAKKSDLVLLDYCYYCHDYISSCCPLFTTITIYYCYHYYY